ncbi:branched-chain amino acid transporter permease [Sulfurospirillum arcachonense]|uniref:branched-chain amino acid transporter permease n=1 Tax=Sulfurospirillum arcachonense TaxID=57666 RepID=UPI0004AF53C2|nr:AzlD domain-containing protein [Sulfurospirillum arcachonense]
METSYLIGAISLAAFVTYVTRIIPFLFFRKKEPSAIIKYIEWNMPVMIMVILVFYALKDVQWEVYPYGIAEIVGVLIATFVHVKFKNALLSIFLATFTYMILIQKVLV